MASLDNPDIASLAVTKREDNTAAAPLVDGISKCLRRCGQLADSNECMIVAALYDCEVAGTLEND